MPDIHPHEDLLELAFPYALDALDDTDRRAVEHLLDRADDATAAEFRATVRELRETLADMTTVDAVPAPPSVEAALLRALDERTTLDRSPSRVLRRLAAAAAVVVAIGIGVGITVARNNSPAPAEITAERVITHGDTRTSTTPVTGGGTMTVHTSRELGAATVAFDAVPAAPDGRVYQMWLIPPNGTPRSAGVLATLPTDTSPMLVRTGDADQVAMSTEPPGGSPAPTDPRVLAPLR
ncbi:anti-sigma factor [Nocardia sp. 2]|uniref:Regulator of SigK n=1 Tax=Nocardia acididurans TaxID=2802282 RepID=A0ABS1MBM0_9NOCA|nr:anti-sigma factor [Nocardia acididurans]MBL1077154.1 anti-sigma factor [Nocardia acididurans]